MWEIRSGKRKDKAGECGRQEVEEMSVEKKRMGSVEDKNSRIKRVRLRFSLTQGQLGQKIGKTAAYINQIERGKVEPTETVINTIADVLEIDKGWLRTGEGEMMKETDLRPISDRIRQIRVEFGENQTNFAEMLGVSRNTISLLECGKITVSGKIIKVLVEKYETVPLQRSVH